MAKSVQDILTLIREKEIQMVDFKMRIEAIARRKCSFLPSVL